VLAVETNADQRCEGPFAVAYIGNEKDSQAACASASLAVIMSECAAVAFWRNCDTLDGIGSMLAVTALRALASARAKDALRALV
jgi:hypothetical protein